MVKSRRRASSSGVPKTLSRRISRSPLSASRAALGVLLLDLARVRAEGGRLDDLRSEEHVGQAEAPADDAAVSEEPLDLLRRGAGDDVEVLRLEPEEQVPHAAADQVGRVIVAAQPLNDLRGVGIDLIRRNLHFGLGLSCPPKNQQGFRSRDRSRKRAAASRRDRTFACRARALWSASGGRFATGRAGALGRRLGHRGGSGAPRAAAAERGAAGGGRRRGRAWGRRRDGGRLLLRRGGGVRSSRTGAAAAATGAGFGAGAVTRSRLGGGRGGHLRRLGRGRGGGHRGRLGRGRRRGAELAAAAADRDRAGEGAAAAGAGPVRGGRGRWGGGGTETAIRSGIDDGMVLVGGTSGRRGAGRAAGATAVRHRGRCRDLGCAFTSTGGGSSALLPCEFTQATTTTETTATTAPDTASRV